MSLHMAKIFFKDHGISCSRFIVSLWSGLWMPTWT